MTTKTETVAKLTSNTLERIVSWLPGWYATRLHAMPAEAEQPVDLTPAQALCGAWVYSKAVAPWAQRRVDKGIPHCKRCEKLIAAQGEQDA